MQGRGFVRLTTSAEKETGEGGWGVGKGWGVKGGGGKKLFACPRAHGWTPGAEGPPARGLCTCMAALQRAEHKGGWLPNPGGPRPLAASLMF